MKLHLLTFALALVHTIPAQAFEINVVGEVIDGFKKTIRASDLAVNDIAYFQPSQLCRMSENLFLPSTQTPRSADETSIIMLKVTFGPGKELTATTVAPTKPGEFTEGDVQGLIGTLFEPSSFFEPGSWDCNKVAELSMRPVEFYPLTSIDGHDNLADLLRDVRQRWTWD